MRRFVIAVLLAAAGVGRADSPPAPDALTEFSAAQWGAEAALGALAVVHDDVSRVHDGSASLRFDTSGGFDTWLWAPQGRNAAWDMLAAGSGGLAFWVRAENPNLGFQERSPWVRLHTDASNYIELRPTYDILNEARGQWKEMRIPYDGDEVWQRTDTGAPNLANVRWVEIHADTWGAGFTLWIDGLRFDLPFSPPRGLKAYAGNAKVDLAWQRYANPTGTFAAYAVYRSTAPITNVTGMTPLATIANINTTQFTDSTAQNGVRYHYAVTARFSGGGETLEVESVGPRTPRNETDLQVVSVARTPRFPRYAPIYTYYEMTEPGGFGPYVFSAATGLGAGQTPQTRRWPNVGEQVTYTASVRNRGTNAVNREVAGTWRVNGTAVEIDRQNVNLAPGGLVAFTLLRTWDGASHDISFTLFGSDARAGNDSLSVNTKSVPFLSFVDRTYEENFREGTANYPLAATDDMIDWLNRHMARFNELFAQAGTAKRVHFDVLEVLADNDPDPGIDTQPFAIFPFRYRHTDGSIRLSGYYRPDDDIDYGLLHEMGHQLGLIDLYRLDLPPQNNHVSSTGYSAVECLMHGVSPVISEHSARAMTRWLETAHGYYGQYLYATPDTIRLRILGQDGRPLPGAVVTAYQKAERPGLGEVITTQPKFAVITDGAGVATLPNVDIDPQLAPPAFNGDVLRDNPFGYLAVVGTNGLLLFKVEHAGFTDYAWLDITEVNVRYERGETAEQVFTRQVSLGGSVQRTPPADMAEQNAADWSVWAQHGTISIHDDAARRVVGAASVRIETDSGFDTYARYPGGLLARWDLSQVRAIRLWAYAENPNIGFQSGSPWLRLGDANGFIELHPTFDILNEAIGRWREFVVPIGGDATWQRSVFGSPDLEAINWLEIHADTWGGGFTLWLDGVGFDPSLCYADCDQSTGQGSLDIFDFLCFQNLYSTNDPRACDCDLSTGPGACDIFDFLCFQNEFADGCP